MVSRHAHQYLDATVEGVRHLWTPSTAFTLPVDMPTRSGETLVGIGLLDVSEEAARFDLWCPDGMKPHDVSALDFFNAATDVVSANAPAQPAVQTSTA